MAESYTTPERGKQGALCVAIDLPTEPSNKINSKTMKKESFYDPKKRLTNPYNLYMKHSVARGNWDTRGMIFYIAAVVCPIVFAFTINPIQLLKLSYLPLSFLIPGLLFNIPSVPSIGKVFWLIQPIIISLPIVAIQVLIPEPIWFALVPFLQIWFFWRMMRVLPNSESLDWRRFTARTGLSIEQCHEIIDQERQKPYSERGLALDSGIQ